MAVTHLRKVELVGKPGVVQGDHKPAHHAVHSIVDTASTHHSLDAQSIAPHAARAPMSGATRIYNFSRVHHTTRAPRVSHTHVVGMAAMLRYVMANHDHTLSGQILTAEGVLSRIKS